MNSSLFFILFLFLPFAAFGAGAILVDNDGTGQAVVWQNGIVTYNPESGDDSTLGNLTVEESRELLEELFDDWTNIQINGVSTVSLTISEGEGLGNVDDSNIDDHFTYCPASESCPTENPPFVIGSATSGESPIIFDNDGMITDAILGSGARRSTLGFAGPRVLERIGGVSYISEAQGVLNGLFINCPEGADSSDPCQTPEVTQEEFEGAVFHELGHFLGLDHTQVNLSSAVKALNGDDSELDAIVTMLPLFIDGEAQRTPHYDDKVATSLLYPTSAYLTSFCTISGTVYEADGVTELQGVNVIAGNASNSLLESTSFVSGSFYTGTYSNCEARQGSFLIGGIRPGESYTLEIGTISQSFTGGSSIEPCDPPLSGFTAKMIAGTFSCSSGGETITTGTEATTSVVTNKNSSSGDDDGGGSGGCSLIPD